jgi:hypothetical protein
MRSITRSALALIIVIGTFATISAKADTLEWNVQSQHPNIVSLEFYSQDYSRAWPGDGEVYLLDDYDTKSFVLSCETGEQICYGAWVRGDDNAYWGVGRDDSNNCSDCCYVCGGGATKTMVLNP